MTKGATPTHSSILSAADHIVAHWIIILGFWQNCSQSEMAKGKINNCIFALLLEAHTWQCSWASGDWGTMGVSGLILGFHTQRRYSSPWSRLLGPITTSLKCPFPPLSCLLPSGARSSTHRLMLGWQPHSPIPPFSFLIKNVFGSETQHSGCLVCGPP